MGILRHLSPNCPLDGEREVSVYLAAAETLSRQLHSTIRGLTELGREMESRRRVVAAAGSVLSLPIAWGLTYWAGGTQTAVPHVFYLPVILSAVFLPLWATLVVCAAAGLVAGPLLPLDVAAGIEQSTANWLIRAAFFLAVGMATRLSVGWLQRAERLERQLDEDRVDITEKRAEIVQIISHEFLTPLTIITPARQMLERGGLSPQQEHQVRDSLVRAATRIEELANVMVAAGQALGTEGRHPTEHVDVADVLDQVIDSLPDLRADRRVEIFIDGDARQVATVRSYLRLMLRSLVENALKYSPSSTTVKVEVRRQRGAVRFRVVDQGPGIAEEQTYRSRQAFSQVDSSTLRQHGGLGMGLYATARLAEKLNGGLEFQRPEEGGFAVCLELPQLRECDTGPQEILRTVGPEQVE